MIKKFFTSLTLALFLSVQLLYAACDSNTVLMLHFDGADGSQTAIDSSISAHTMTASDNAQLDTSQKKFGSASAYFDGTQDKFSSVDSADWDYGTGDFTIEGWIRWESSVGNDDFFDRNQGTDYALWHYAPLGGMLWQSGGANTMARSWSPSADTWYHFAIVRASSVLKMFVDGTQIGTDAANATDLTYSAAINIGSDAAGNNGLAGWLDEVRVSKGIARYTANFTPQTAEFCGATAGTSNFFQVMD